jgi:beta-lactamase class A
VAGGAAASAAVASDAKAAARVATAQGYRTGLAVLDLRSGQYVGAGDDTGQFASESVVKVMIATELLATGGVQLHRVRR